jgi:hypothetical protein
MDYVYTCRSGDNEELRYSIRSLVKNLPEVNVWIVGDAPSWYTGSIVRVDRLNQKYKTVRNNLDVLSKTDEINEQFVLMNDDFFVTRPMDSIEVWHGGSLLERYNRRLDLEGYSTYAKYLIDTYNTISHFGIEDPLYYELHTPLPMTKLSLSHAVTKPGLWRSITANANAIGGKQMEDVKVYAAGTMMSRAHREQDTSTYLSTDDGSFEKLYKERLRDEFPEPSLYESI